MHLFSVLVFVLTYAGVAMGRVPGLLLDRTGIALLGAIAMVAGGVLPLSFALAAIDHGTILLLFALMIVSAQLRLGGFYTFAGNLLLIGSIANLIVVEQARVCGVDISFREHACIGLPVTLASLMVLLAWIGMTG